MVSKFSSLDSLKFCSGKDVGALSMVSDSSWKGHLDCSLGSKTLDGYQFYDNVVY